VLVPVAARSSAARLLRLWVRIPPGAWMFICCEFCVLSGRCLCDGLITRPDESYRMWRVVVCDQETSKNEEAKAHYRAVKIQPKWVVTPGKQTNNPGMYGTYFGLYTYAILRNVNTKTKCGFVRRANYFAITLFYREVTQYHTFCSTEIGNALA